LMEARVVFDTAPETYVVEVAAPRFALLNLASDTSCRLDVRILYLFIQTEWQRYRSCSW
jgi:hypothetical protein